MVELSATAPAPCEYGEIDLSLSPERVSCVARDPPFLRPYRLTVRTRASQARNPGATPGGVIVKKYKGHSKGQVRNVLYVLIVGA